LLSKRISNLSIAENQLVIGWLGQQCYPLPTKDQTPGLSLNEYLLYQALVYDEYDYKIIRQHEQKFKIQMESVSELEGLYLALIISSEFASRMAIAPLAARLCQGTAWAEVLDFLQVFFTTNMTKIYISSILCTHLLLPLVFKKFSEHNDISWILLVRVQKDDNILIGCGWLR
jgi:hypothetical protein